MYPGEKMPLAIIIFIILSTGNTLVFGYVTYVFNGLLSGLLGALGVYLLSGLGMWLIVPEERFYKVLFGWLYFLFYPEKLQRS